MWGQSIPKSEQEEMETENEEVTFKASEELFRTREKVVTSSKNAAQNRIRFQLQQVMAIKQYKVDDLILVRDRIKSQMLTLDSLECKIVESGFSRPVSGVAFYDNKLYAGDWSGKISLIEQDGLGAPSSDQAHMGKVCLSAWRNGVLSGGLEGNIKVSKSLTLQSLHRVADVDGHPILDLVVGAYFDKTWKLWDVNHGIELLNQVGHSREVFTTKFHPDGSLVATGGLDGRTIVWDLRSGRSIMTLGNHLGEIYALDWCEDGYNLATGGADNNVLIWDMRKQENRMIPAHNSIVSSVKFIGSIVLTGSYDKTVKLWNSKTGSLITTKKLSDKVMCLDFSKDQLAVGKWDRTMDVWAPVEPLAGLN